MSPDTVLKYVKALLRLAIPNGTLIHIHVHYPDSKQGTHRYLKLQDDQVRHISPTEFRSAGVDILRANGGSPRVGHTKQRW